MTSIHNTLSDKQIEEKFTILAAETAKYGEMYRNFDDDISSVVLHLGTLIILIKERQQNQELPLEEEQHQYTQFIETLYQLNKEVIAFCVYEGFLTGKQQDNEFYKKIPSLIEPHKKTLPFLKHLKTLIEATEIFKEDEAAAIRINPNILNECYRSLYKIIIEVRLVKPFRDFHSSIKNLLQKYNQQIDYKAVEQDLVNIINKQKKIPEELRLSEYYKSIIDWRFFEVVTKKYKTAIHNDDKKDILNNIKYDVLNFSLNLCKVTLHIQNLGVPYFTGEIKISEFKLQNPDYLRQDYEKHIIQSYDQNQYNIKECNESLLQLTKYLKVSPILMIDEVTFHIPNRFEVACLLSEDFPVVSTDNIKFIQEATWESFRFEKLNQHLDQKLIQVWQKKTDELEKNTDVTYIPLIAHLQMLQNFWTKDKLKADSQSDHHSLQWYNACEAYNYVLFKKFFKNADLSRFVEAIVLSKLQTYMENISILTVIAIKHYYMGDVSLDPKLFQIWRDTLKQSPKDIIETNKRISDFIVNGAESIYANKIHDHTKSLLVNEDYFKSIDSPLLLSDQSTIKNIPYMYNITSSVYEMSWTIKNFEFNKFKLLKFISHLSMIPHPQLQLTINDLSPELQEQYDIFMKKMLQNEGYINSEGMIIRSKVYKNYLVEPMKLEIGDRFIGYLIKTREQFIKEKLKMYTTLLSDEVVTVLKLNMEHSLRELEYKKKLISSFDGFSSLALISGAMEKTENLDKSNQIQQLVKDCFSIAYLNEGRFKNNKLSEVEKHNYAFKLSGDIVQKFLNSDHSFIFQVITPEKDHAFYIAIKNIFHKSQFQIMIVNGSGLNLHRRDESIADSKYKDPTHGAYRVMGSELFDKNEYKEFLQHYIYGVLVFSHTSEIDNDKNIYLLKDITRGVAKFHGFGKNFDIPKALSLDLLFRAQTSDNCTIHNLKNCIRHLLDMSISEYAIFESELLKGTDKMLSELLKSLVETNIGNIEERDLGLIFTETLKCNTGYMFTNKMELKNSHVCTTNEYKTIDIGQGSFFDSEIVNPINMYD